MKKEIADSKISQDHAQLLRAALERACDQAKTIRQGLDSANVGQAASRQLAVLILESAKVIHTVATAGPTDDPAPVPEKPPAYEYGDNQLDLLTPRQRQILEYIREHVASRGYPPTVRDIGLAVGIGSPNGVMCHLKALEKKGCITRSHNRSRGLKLLDQSHQGT